MKNTENKKISILAIIIAMILIVFFNIIKVNTEVTEKIGGDKIITTTSKIILFGEEYSFESSIALCFFIILIAVIAYFFTDDSQIKHKVIETKNKGIELLTSTDKKRSRATIIGYATAIVIILICVKALLYYKELTDLENENPYVVYSKWQASFLGFMKIGQFALPFLIIFKLISLFKKKK